MGSPPVRWMLTFQSQDARLALLGEADAPNSLLDDPDDVRQVLLLIQKSIVFCI